MKKLCIIAISAVLCMGLALPAMAEVKVSGLITMDVYRYSVDDPTGATNGVDTTQFAIYSPINYMRANYTSSDKTFGGRFTIYTGRYNDTSADTGGGSGVWDVKGGSNYIWWKPMPELELKIVSIPQIVG